MDDRQQTVLFIRGTCAGIEMVIRSLEKKHNDYVLRGNKTLAGEVWHCLAICRELLKTMTEGREVMEMPPINDNN